MALPTIIFNSGTGSDTAASGAGPTTALTGSSASTNGGGTVVTLDGSPDLSGVATDGSHVIYLADGTAGNRNFGKITAADNSAKTVTVSDAFGGSLSGLSWAIGGKRNSINTTSSRKLADNNGAAGDAMPGWVVQFEANDTVTGSTIVWRRAGDTTDGPIIIRGDSATSHRVLNQTANAAVFSSASNAAFIMVENLQFTNSNGTKTSAHGLTLTASAFGFFCRNCIFGDATNQLLGAANISTGDWIFEDCEVKDTTSNGISSIGASADVLIRNIWIHDCAGAGILLSGTAQSLSIQDSLVTDNTGDGINYGNAIAPGVSVRLDVKRCTIHGNGGDGIEILNIVAVPGSTIRNNNITGNGGYGINSVANTDNIVNKNWSFNNFGTGATANTSGAANNYTLASTDLQVDPGYTSAAGNNYAVGTNVKAKGYPDATKTLGAGKSVTTSFVDIGAAQREEPSGGGTMLGQRHYPYGWRQTFCAQYGG